MKCANKVWTCFQNQKNTRGRERHGNHTSTNYPGKNPIKRVTLVIYNIHFGLTI